MDKGADWNRRLPGKNIRTPRLTCPSFYEDSCKDIVCVERSIRKKRESVKRVSGLFWSGYLYAHRI
jgi:hypothetical protein